MSEKMVTCLECKRKLNLTDAAKLELLYKGEISKRIVNRISYFHNKCFYSFLEDYWEWVEENKELQGLLKHKNPEKQKEIKFNLAFKAIVMDLAMGLDDDLSDKANIRLKVSGKGVKSIDRVIKRDSND